MLNDRMKGCDSFLGIQDTLKALADPIRREILNLLKEEPRVIEKNDKYTIQSTVDRFSANQYYELSGGLASGNYVVIRMSVESFRESIAIANKFYLGVGISLILVTTLIIIWITRKYTQPLLQLADISKRMSELDFNVKYEDDRDDEIGVLGESMNEMSDKLETAISELKSANLQLHKDIAKKEEVDEMRQNSSRLRLLQRWQNTDSWEFRYQRSTADRDVIL